MTVHTICDRCGMEYDWAGVTVGSLIYCCTGCAAGGPCICPRTATDTVVVTKPGDTVVAGPGETIIAANDDVVVVR